jgi:hypothetical protein
LTIPFRARRARRLGALALAFSTLWGCATVRRPRGAQAIAPVTAGTASAEWSELLTRRAALASIQAYLRIRATTGADSQSFRATLSRDSSNRVKVEALTPLGTAAFTIFSDGSEAIFLDHLHRRFWSGPASSIPDIAGGVVPAVNLPELALLLIGLPIDNAAPAARCETCPAEPDRIVMQQGEIRYTVGSGGLARAVLQRNEERITVDYSPPAFPPATVSVGRSVGGSSPASETLVIQILDLVSDPHTVARPSIPAGYVERATGEE